MKIYTNLAFKSFLFLGLFFCLGSNIAYSQGYSEDGSSWDIDDWEDWINENDDNGDGSVDSNEYDFDANQDWNGDGYVDAEDVQQYNDGCQELGGDCSDNEICIGGCGDNSNNNNTCLECACDPFYCPPVTDPYPDTEEEEEEEENLCPSGDYCECFGLGCPEDNPPPCPSNNYDQCGVCDGDGSSCKKQKDCEKARIAMHVYNTLNGLQNPDESPLYMSYVSLVGANDPLLNGLNIDFSKDNGFNSSIFKVEHANGDIELIYSFAGTADFADIGDDISQAVGEFSGQYLDAYNNARKFKFWAEENGYDISFTGHSLGGGLANVAALATGYPALLFNPAGLSDGTINGLNLNLMNSSLVDAYVVKGEIVSGLNAVLGTPVRGNVTEIDDALSAAAELFYMTTPGRSAVLHTMSEVLKALGC